MKIQQRMFIVGALLLGGVFFITTAVKRNAPVGATQINATAQPKATLVVQAPLQHTGTFSPANKFVTPVLDREGNPLPVFQTKAGPAYQSEIIRLAVKTPEVQLTGVEINKLQKIYSKVFEARADIEVRLAKVTSSSATENLVEIPEYSLEGAKLRQTLLDGIHNTLSGGRADLFINNFMQHLDDANAGWGRFSQQILISLDASQNQYEFIHTLRLPSLSPTGYVEQTTVSTLKPTDLDKYAKLSDMLPKS